MGRDVFQQEYKERGPQRASCYRLTTGHGRYADDFSTKATFSGARAIPARWRSGSYTDLKLSRLPVLAWCRSTGWLRERAISMAMVAPTFSGVTTIPARWQSGCWTARKFCRPGVLARCRATG